MMPKKLTESQEDEIYNIVEFVKSNNLKSLEERYNISRTTLLNALKRSKSRRLKASNGHSAESQS